MSIKRIIYKAEVDRVIDHAPLVRELRLRFKEPREFYFRAGQFVMLHVPSNSPIQEPILRAYSIASDDRKTDEIRLLFKHVQGGIASTFVWTLVPGQELLLTGPFGRVFFETPPSTQIVFLCTGTGLAQHLCYLTSKADLFPNSRYRLFFGLLDEASIFCVDDLEQMKKKLPHFSYDIVLSEPSESWRGKRGYLQDFVETIDDQSMDTSFYLCGNGQMIKAVKEKLLEMREKKIKNSPPNKNPGDLKVFSEVFG